MKLIKRSIFFLSLLALIACSNQYRDTNVERFFSDVRVNSEFSLDTVSVGEWDTVYIAKPYDDVESFGIKMSGSVKRAMKNRLLTESYSALIFTKDGNCSHYAIIERGGADLSSLPKNKYASNQVYTLGSNGYIIAYPKKITNVDAIKYYTKARFDAEYSMEKGFILDAIALLDSAIMLEPEYLQAYTVKQMCQVKLGDYEGAMNTAKIIEKLDPSDRVAKFSIGIYSLLNKDSHSAEKSLLQVDSLFSVSLDTISADNSVELFNILLNKAFVLKLLGKDAEVNEIRNRILIDTIFGEDQRNMIDSFYLDRSKEEFTDSFLQGMKEGIVTE